MSRSYVWDPLTFGTPLDRVVRGSSVGVPKDRRTLIYRKIQKYPLGKGEKEEGGRVLKDVPRETEGPDTVRNR
jgi:hypothetical protein